ncbi:MAG TPA: FAD/NAD(P)-binding protein [Myxococcaceae bacterium]
MDRLVDVAVVGGGASGVLTAAWLLRMAKRSGPGFRVALIERQARAGGVAYGTRRPEHLLNVPAGRMSADPADPLHFVRWAKGRVRGVAPGAFLQRRRYGEYLRWFLENAVRAAAPGVELVRVRGEAVRVSKGRGGYRVRLRSGRSLRALWVVLATGNAAPEPLPGVAPELRARGVAIEDPWPASLAKVPVHGTVVLVGSGLTAVDAIATLRARGHRGRILAVSRHGLLPRPHLAVAPVREGGLPRERSLRSLLGWLRRSGDGWRSALDVLRPASSALWRGLAEEERARFLRHLRTRWDVHRHRMPPRLDALLRELLAERRLRVIAGQVVGASPSGREIQVRIRRRGGARPMTVEAELLVNCTGPSPESALGAPLMQGLLEDGLASVDTLGLGLRTRGGALLDVRGRATPRLLAVGPLRRGELWETTAIPEIRVQAKEAAERILARVAAERPAARSERAASDRR